MRFQWHYAWIILFVSFLGLLAVQGVRLAFGAFLEPWQTSMNTDRGTIALVSSVSFIVYGITVPVFGKLTDRYGVTRVFGLSTLLTGASTVATAWASEPWHLFVLYGVISSIGFGGASGVVATVAVTNWFAARRGTAYGILEAGFGAGQMIMAPAALFSIVTFGWEKTAVGMGIVLVCVIFPLVMLLLRTKPEEKGTAAYGAGEQEEKEASPPTAPKDDPSKRQEAGSRMLLRSSSFWLLLVPFFICGYTTTGLMDTHLIPFSHGAGHSTEVTGAAVGLLAAFNIVGCLISGKLADLWSPAKILAVLYITRAASMVLLLATDNTVWLFVFAIAFGLVDFATVAPTTLFASQHFSQYSLGFVFGLLTMSHQIGSALGSYVPGWLYTVTGSYFDAFASAVALLGIAAASSVWLVRKTHLQDNRSQLQT